ncbi:uncharacterized protein BX663DRAFT_572103 [Cokeromyces recurvatus]|uniref:uncharacterized protein n=1 Tax=Cokeromyces recurvatus TaxID=90255 RepID=UPI002220111A|nr:uncharacterized protein BX663DRAFT_572103 [Cokeromyces recurvatus]KAI7901475.1 hypothetical protein BX663DRAFT_572103 [Cokeromyces recurvatus]
MAAEDLKQAYVMCLQKQAEHAFTNKERYFECYAHIDFVNKLWTPIFELYFCDAPNVILKWGETVLEKTPLLYTASTLAKQAHTICDRMTSIGDKVDLRIISTAGHDVLNFEFARYSEDRRKILRESKNNGDYVYRATCIKNKMKKGLKNLGIQVAATEGEITETYLQDDGLYTSRKMGSLRLPSCTADLKVLCVLFERLDKRNAVHIKTMTVKSKEREKLRSTRIQVGQEDLGFHQAHVKMFLLLAICRNISLSPLPILLHKK